VILAALAAIWLAVGVYLYAWWVPAAEMRDQAVMRNRVSADLGRVGADGAEILARGDNAEIGNLLRAALAGHADWLALGYRGRDGGMLGVAGAGAGDAVRTLAFEQPVTRGTSVIGWLSVTMDASDAVASRVEADRQLYAALAAGLAATLAAAAFLVHGWFKRPLRELAAAVDTRLKQLGSPSPPADDRDIVTWLGKAVASLADVVKAREQEIREALVRQQEMADTLKASEERYALAVRGADDGLWEWDTRSGRVFYSVRWKSLLGFSDAEVGDSIEEWKSRIHPDDLAAVIGAAEAHLRGESPRFERDHRLRTKCGEYLWVHARGAAIRGADGTAQRLVGLNTNISARKRAEETLIALADGLSTVRGEGFFRALVRNFARALGVRYAFITECVDYPVTRVRKLATWKDDAFIDNKEFELQGTPCFETITQGRACLYRHDVAELFPKERGTEWQSYLGLPIFDAGNHVIGHLACFHDRPLEGELPIEPIFTLFAVRAGIELERRMLLSRLALAEPEGGTNLRLVAPPE
jgi:PAS domain S-box-containing protein